MNDEEYKGEFRTRLRTLRGQAGVSLSKFSKILNIPQRTLESWESGVSFPSVKNLYAIARRLGVDLNWLILGKANANEPHRYEVGNNGVLFPVLGNASAGGHGFVVNAAADHYIEWPPGIRDPKAFGFAVHGESMIPVYKDGDVVICSRAGRLHPDCDAVVAIGDDCFVKIWRPLPDNQVELACYNAQGYSPITVERSKITAQAPIIGLLRASQAAEMRVDAHSNPHKPEAT